MFYHINQAIQAYQPINRLLIKVPTNQPTFNQSFQPSYFNFNMDSNSDNDQETTKPLDVVKPRRNEKGQYSPSEADRAFFQSLPRSTRQQSSQNQSDDSDTPVKNSPPDQSTIRFGPSSIHSVSLNDTTLPESSTPVVRIARDRRPTSNTETSEASTMHAPIDINTRISGHQPDPDTIDETVHPAPPTYQSTEHSTFDTWTVNKRDKRPKSNTAGSTKTTTVARSPPSPQETVIESWTSHIILLHAFTRIHYYERQGFPSTDTEGIIEWQTLHQRFQQHFEGQGFSYREIQRLWREYQDAADITSNYRSNQDQFNTEVLKTIMATQSIGNEERQMISVIMEYWKQYGIITGREILIGPTRNRLMRDNNYLFPDADYIIRGIVYLQETYNTMKAPEVEYESDDQYLISSNTPKERQRQYRQRIIPKEEKAKESPRVPIIQYSDTEESSINREQSSQTSKRAISSAATRSKDIASTSPSEGSISRKREPVKDDRTKRLKKQHSPDSSKYRSSEDESINEPQRHQSIGNKRPKIQQTHRTKSIGRKSIEDSDSESSDNYSQSSRQQYRGVMMEVEQEYPERPTTPESVASVCKQGDWDKHIQTMRYMEFKKGPSGSVPIERVNRAASPISKMGGTETDSLEKLGKRLHHQIQQGVDEPFIRTTNTFYRNKGKPSVTREPDPPIFEAKQPKLNASVELPPTKFNQPWDVRLHEYENAARRQNITEYQAVLPRNRTNTNNISGSGPRVVKDGNNKEKEFVSSRGTSIYKDQRKT